MKSGSDNESKAKRSLTRRELLQAGAVAGLGAGLIGSSLGAAACGSLLALEASLLLVLTLRKFPMEAAADVGDKSVFAYLEGQRQPSNA